MDAEGSCTGFMKAMKKLVADKIDTIRKIAGGARQSDDADHWISFVRLDESITLLSSHLISHTLSFGESLPSAAT